MRTQGANALPLDDEQDPTPEPVPVPTGIIVSRANETPEDHLQQVLGNVGFIRLRMPIHVWDGKQYAGVRNTTNKVEVQSTADAEKVLQALTSFFHRLEASGAAETIALLQAGAVGAEADLPKRRATDSK